VALVVGAFVASLAPIADGDVFWHLAAGREMVTRHALLHTDPFSVSAAGRPWPDVHWLFQLAAYGVYAASGLTGLVLVKSLLVATGAFTLYAAVDRRGRALFVPALLVALVLGRHLLLVRPVIVTLVLLALFFLQLERYGRERRATLLVPLPLLSIVWTNVQGLFALGPALIGAYAVGALATAAFGDRAAFRVAFAREGGSREKALRRAKELGVATALSLVASFVTPFGGAALALPMRLLARITPGHANVFSASVAENVPPFVLERSSPAEIWHFKWFLALLAVGLLLAARRLRLAHLFMLGGLVVLSLMGNRNVALLYWLAPAIVATALAPGLAAFRRSVRGTRKGLAARVLVPATVLVTLAVAGVAAAREPGLAAPAPFRFPEASADRIAALRGGGEVFSADHQGGYLIWRLYPRFRPYIDTRLILRTAAEYEEYLRFADEPSRFDDFQRRHAFAAVVLPVAYPDRYLGLIRHLYASRDFELAYTDGSEVLFLRREGWGDDGMNLGDPATTRRLMTEADARFHGDARLIGAARVNLATLDVVLGEMDEASRVLAGMTAPDAVALSARVRLAKGDLDGAEKLGTRALDDDARDVRALNLLATVSARRGELRRAGGFLRKSLAVDPFDVEASNLLAAMEEHQHEH
jgi:tetratricopeptide (TPR) repeat protein